MSRGATVPNCKQQIKVHRSQVGLDRVQIIEQAGEEPEEGLLLEVGSLFFVHVCEYKHDDSQDLRHVVNFRLVVIDSRRVAVILDDVDNEARHCIQSLEGVSKLARSRVLIVRVHARFGTYPEEKRRYIFNLQNTLLGQCIDERHERLLRRVRALVDADPLLEPHEQLLSKLGIVRLCGWLTRNCGIGRCLSGGLVKPTKVVQQT